MSNDTDRAGLVRRLRDLATEMESVSVEMNQYARHQWDGETADHAKELLGAAGISRSWADWLGSALDGGGGESEMPILSDLPPGVEPHMLPGSDDSVPVIVHCGDTPDERIECVVQLDATSEWLVATWVPEVQRWRFAYGEPQIEARADQIVMWADLRELFGA